MNLTDCTHQQKLVNTLQAHGFDRMWLSTSEGSHSVSLEDWANPQKKFYQQYQDPQTRWFATISKDLEIAIISSSKERMTWNVYPKNSVTLPSANKVRQVYYHLLLINHWIERRLEKGPIKSDDTDRWTVDSINSLSFGAQDALLINQLNPSSKSWDVRLIRLEELNITALKCIKTFILECGGYTRDLPPSYWQRSSNLDSPRAGEAFENIGGQGSVEYGYTREDAEKELILLQQQDSNWQLWESNNKRWLYLVKVKPSPLETLDGNPAALQFKFG